MKHSDDYNWQRIQHISKFCSCGGARKIIDADFDDYSYKTDNGAHFLVECDSCGLLIADSQNHDLPKWHFYRLLIKNRSLKIKKDK